MARKTRNLASILGMYVIEASLKSRNLTDLPESLRHDNDLQGLS